MSTVNVKATIVSKSGPQWEQELLSQYKQKVLVAVPQHAPVSTLKEKLLDKFLSANLADLNNNKELLKKNGIARITGAKITALHTKEGFDVDEDSILDDLYLLYKTKELEFQAEVDLISVRAEPKFCCGLF